MEERRFRLFCLTGGMATCLVFMDRSIPYDAVWNTKLCLLLGPFIFGFIYRFEFFAISFWLMVILGITDLLMGPNLSVTGASCWSGFEVWALTLPAGFAGCLISYLVPQGHKTRDNIVQLHH